MIHYFNTLLNLASCRNNNVIMFEINVKNETSQLKSVVLGTAIDFGGTPTLDFAYDPKSKEHIRNETFPIEAELIVELDGFAHILEQYEVEVLRPELIPNCNQIFTRDIGIVIDNKFVWPNILEKRLREKDGIKYLIDDIPPSQVLFAPESSRMEGGDVMPSNEFLFVGYSKAEDFARYEVSRTNEAGLNFLIESFPNKKVMGFELNKSDTDPRQNALHLDCCFQPVGKDQAIIFKGGFKDPSDYDFLVNYFGKKNIIEIDQEEMYKMNSNVFSISPDTIVSAQSFQRLNRELEDRGFNVVPIKYCETAKMEGLLRCSTLPLLRD